MEKLILPGHFQGTESFVVKLTVQMLQSALP